MELVRVLLILIVFLGPIAMVAYALRSKLGLTRPSDPERSLDSRDELHPPPLLAVLIWLLSLAALIYLGVRGGS